MKDQKGLPRWGLKLFSNKNIVCIGSSSSRQVYDESGIFILTNGYLTEGRKNAKNIQEGQNMKKEERTIVQKMLFFPLQ